jgi:quinoprotein glucose dehydrogenase
MKRLLGISLAGIIAVGAGVWAQQSGKTQSAVPDGDWRTINRDLAADRYSPLKQINASNVSSLKEAWTTRLGGGATSVPLVVNGVMYVSSGTRVVALDGDTGKEIWAHALQAAAPAPAAPPTDAQGPAPAGGGGGGRGRGGPPPGPTASARGVGEQIVAALAR